ncbi:FabG domain-containing protein [Hyaloraphidium curvatum]|nr:FabG domain-containing protein [Hyaloraphidium curvatum]
MSALAAARALNARRFPGRSALVVGGTSGLGRAIGVRLAAAGMDVAVAGRSVEAGEEVVKEMKEAAGGGEGQNLEFLKVDASLLQNLKELAETRKKLDVLVVTQGIATMQGRTETAEGIDVKMQLHYYGRMALIQLLLPLLRQSPSPRVLSVLSAGVHSPYAGWKTDPELKTTYSLKNAADAAGFYTDLCLDTFSRDPANANITFAHAAPGVVATNWGTELPWLARKAARAMMVFATKKEDAAEFLSTPLLADDKDARKGLVLIGKTGQDVGKSSGHTEEAREAVWKSTKEVWARAGINV